MSVDASSSVLPIGRRTRSHRLRTALSPRVIGAIYVWIALVVVFGLIDPSTMLTWATVKQVLNQYAVTGLVALALVMPLAAGVYDLSVGSVAGLSGIATAYTLAHISTNTVVALAAGIAMALACGLVNAIAVQVLRVDSFIGTLATGSIFGALAIAISGEQPISKNVGGSFSQAVALDNIAGVTRPVIYLAIAGLVLWYVLQRHAVGRYVTSLGFDREVARLAGVPIGRLVVISLLVSAVLAGIGGIAATATVGAGSSTIGPSYLLPGFAAAFLGATQFQPGRFNVGGTIVAVFLIGTGDVGLLLVGAPAWAPDIFDGVILIAAVSIASLSGLIGMGRASRWRRRSTATGDGAGDAA
jgi:ribose transport system permease protein